MLIKPRLRWSRVHPEASNLNDLHGIRVSCSKLIKERLSVVVWLSMPPRLLVEQHSDDREIRLTTMSFDKLDHLSEQLAECDFFFSQRDESSGYRYR